jgi:hypothetical protein
LYALCYLFNTNELTNFALKNTKEETAQYSLHVVGLVINNHLNKTIIIADPNGALIGGSNMEFISMPLSKLRSKPTTCVSSYDTKELNKEMKAENPVMKQARIL